MSGVFDLDEEIFLSTHELCASMSVCVSFAASIFHTTDDEQHSGSISGFAG